MMRQNDFRRFFQAAALAATCAVAAPGIASAQNMADTTARVVQTNDVDEDRDYGWLGLLGLAGLLGLRRREVHRVERVDQVDTTRRPLT